MHYTRFLRITFVAAALAALACTASCGKSDPEAEAKRKLDHLRTKMTAEMEKEIAAGGIDPAKQAERERLMKVEMQKVMGGSEGEAAEVMKVVMKLMQDMQTELAPYNQRTDQLGPLLDLAALKTKEGLDKAEAELTWVVAESKRLETVVGGLPDMLTRAVRSVPGTTDKDIEQARIGSKLDRMQPILLTIRKCDTRMWEVWQTRLRLMRAEIGKWKHDPATGVIEFEREAANTEFNATADAMDAISKEQLEAQAKMVALQKE